MNLRKEYFFFAIIVLINIFFKSLFCDNSPYSFDEIISVKNTLLHFGHIKHQSEWDNNPPFYYYCLWVWHNGFMPIGEFNSRFLSVIFVSISIGLIYLFARKHFDDKTAILSSVLLSLSNFLTYYSQESRTYSLVLLLSVISTQLFFNYIKDPKIVFLLALSLINFLVIYSHYIAGILVLIQYSIVLMFCKQQAKLYFAVQTFLIVGLVLLRFTKKQFYNIFNFNKNEDFWLSKATLFDLQNVLLDLFYNKVTAVVFTLTLMVLIYKQFKNQQDYLNVRFYCLLMGFFSIAFLFLLGNFKPVFLSRYLIFCVPFATIIVIDELMNRKIYGQATIFVLIGMQFVNCKIKKESGSDYKSIAEIVKKFKSKDDIVIINTRDNLLLFEYYFDRKIFMKYQNLDSICNSNNIYGLNNLQKVQELPIKKNSLVFLFQSFHKINRNDNPFLDYFSDRLFKVFSTNRYNGVELSIFKNIVKN